MDYILNIIIPKEELRIAKLEEKLIEWGGGVYSREPSQYTTDSNIIFEQIEDVKYFSKVVGAEIASDTIILELKSDILFDLEYAVNSADKILEQDKLFVFLNGLFELSEFYILLFREDEKVKERYKIMSKEEIGVRLSSGLSWSNPKDIVLFKNKES